MKGLIISLVIVIVGFALLKGLVVGLHDLPKWILGVVIFGPFIGYAIYHLSQEKK